MVYNRCVIGEGGVIPVYTDLLSYLYYILPISILQVRQYTCTRPYTGYTRYMCIQVITTSPFISHILSYNPITMIKDGSYIVLIMSDIYLIQLACHY